MHEKYNDKSVDVKPSTTETYSGLLDSIEEINFDYPPDSGWDRDLEKEFDQEHFAKQLLIYKIDFILYLWVNSQARNNIFKQV